MRSESTIGIKRLHAPENEKSYMLVPQWLIDMNKTNFFVSCDSHRDAKKNDLDHFCIDCRQSFCLNCLPSHVSHKNVKIRRYIYSDVINRQDLCKLFNCSGIQTYHTNKAKVVFLKQRRQQQQNNNSKEYKEFKCTICCRSLQDNCSRYCSIACKVLAINEDNNFKKKIDFEADSYNHKGKDGGFNLLKDRLNEQYVALPYPQRQKLRKGVPLRSPLF